ncbi:MAG: MptD family putative ECF transporter S component [Propionibacteriaceae bacterium]|jgi:energy-coupling factor transport system substrate-specific component|nr:MptD family putative ECF transporter S component [Propionibacteriaceae bacterium]
MADQTASDQPPSAADSTVPPGVPVAPGSTGAPAATSRFPIAFSARDLLNVALFAVVYCAIIVAISLLGTVSGFVLLVTIPLSAGVAAVPFMLFLGRVRHAGMVTLFGVAVAVLLLVVGHVLHALAGLPETVAAAMFLLVVGHPWQSTVITIGVALLADLIVSAGRYRSKWAAMGSYIVFSVSFMGAWIPFLVDPVAYLLGHSDPTGVDDSEQVVTLPSVAMLVAIPLIFGFWGALFGAKLLGKQYRKVDRP